MTVYVHDKYGTEYEIHCERWEHEDERYVFWDDRKIVAVFQSDAIVGFTVKR